MVEPVHEVVLNAVELIIDAVTVTGVDGKIIAGMAYPDEAAERVVLALPQTLQPRVWLLDISFHGLLNNKLHGFYRSTYKDQAGGDHILACTQFQSTDARRAFPCWDEPAFKAVFKTTLEIDAHLQAISNTAIVEETVIPGMGKKKVVFADTMRMSTYLVAFIVGQFEETDPVLVNGKPLRVCVVPGKRHLTEFAIDVGTSSLSFFSRYYGLDNPCDKLDLVAIPDFAFGAMENLGAITFRETDLLLDKTTAAHRELERVADTVAHEIAHMWFGNLVTMRWWNGLWLNEAFATFMAILAVDAFRPEWQRWQSFAVSRAEALVVDGLKNTRAIEYPVRWPEEAEDMFDVLTYEKGAAVLRMLQQYLGPDEFRKGVNLYLRKHAYGNAETTDLWDAMEASANRPVRTLMHSWVFQPGYPLITVRVEQSSLVVSQQLFQYLPDGSETTRLWDVPLSIRANMSGEMYTDLVLLSGQELRIPVSVNPKWIIVSASGHGFYRVNYSPDLFNRVIENLRQLTAMEQFDLVNDTWAAVLAGLSPIGTYLDLVQLLRNEKDPNVWNVILQSLRYLEGLLDPHQRFGLRLFVRTLLYPVSQQVGWDPEVAEPEITGQLRCELIDALGTLGNDAVTQVQARARFRQYLDNPALTDRSLVPALISVTAYTGDRTDYEEFLRQYQRANTPQEERRYLLALAQFQASDLIEQTLALTLSAQVRIHNAPYLMRALLFNTTAREQAWDFIKQHWDEMVERYSEDSITRMCEGIIALISLELEADAQVFFSSHPFRKGRMAIAQLLERLHVGVSCKQRETANISAYFKRRPYIRSGNVS